MGKMMDAHRRIVTKSCFSTDRVAETISYNGTEIPAIVEIGASLSRSDWNDAATTIEEARLIDVASFSVLDTDVPDPQEGDEIVWNGDTYHVARVTSHDEYGANFVLDAMKEGRAYGR